MTEKFIKISDLKKKLNYIFRSYGVSPQTRKTINEAINKIPYAIKGDLETTLEVADVQEVRHGKWFGTVCTNCGESTSDYYDCDYCPHCGARMDGEDGGENG